MVCPEHWQKQMDIARAFLPPQLRDGRIEFRAIVWVCSSAPAAATAITTCSSPPQWGAALVSVAATDRHAGRVESLPYRRLEELAQPVLDLATFSRSGPRTEVSVTQDPVAASQRTVPDCMRRVTSSAGPIGCAVTGRVPQVSGRGGSPEGSAGNSTSVSADVRCAVSAQHRERGVLADREAQLDAVSQVELGGGDVRP